MLSKKTVWENYDALMLDKDLECIGTTKDVDVACLGELVASHGIIGFDFEGLLWKNDGRQPDMERFNMDSICTVAGILATIDRLFDQSPSSYTRWRSSYGLKHDIEFIRRHRGDVNPYVSNGEFIAGYLHYMSAMLWMCPGSIRSRIKPELPGGLNLFMKVSPAYQGIADLARERRN